MNDEEKREIIPTDRQCRYCKEFKRYYIIRNDSLTMTFFGRCYFKKTNGIHKSVEDVCPHWSYGQHDEHMPLFGNVITDALEVLTKTDDQMTHLMELFPDFESLDYRILKRRAGKRTKICPTCRYFTQYYFKSTNMMRKSACGECTKKNKTVKRIYSDCEQWEERSVSESYSETIRILRNQAFSLCRLIRQFNFILYFLKMNAKPDDYEYDFAPYKLKRTDDLPEPSKPHSTKFK